MTINALSLEYEFHISCINTIILEIAHLELKMKSNEFNIKDIDCINTDILRIQHYYISKKDDISLTLFNDIADDFSYYLESSNILEENNERSNSNKSNSNDSTITNNNMTDEFDNDRLVYLNIIKSISKDENFFNINHHFLNNNNNNNNNNKTNKNYYGNSKTSLGIMKIMYESSKDFEEQRKLERFLLITVAEKIYLNLSLIFYVFKNPTKTEVYPIAKSIATVSKGADDCSLCLKFLLESAELNTVPLRFRYVKSWVFYQCCIVYIFRYVATQEKLYRKENLKNSCNYSVFSSFPQETLAPCYFYLDLLKDMKRYFVNVSTYIKEIKLLIYEAKRSIQDRTFHIHIPNLLL